MTAHDAGPVRVPVPDNAPEWDACCSCGWYDYAHGSEARAIAAAEQHQAEA